MLTTLIQRYDKNHFISRTRDSLKFNMMSGATFHVCINTIHQLIKPFLYSKMPIFDEYGAFKGTGYTWEIFSHVLKGRQLFDFQLAVLLRKGSKFFPHRVDPLSKERCFFFFFFFFFFVRVTCVIIPPSTSFMMPLL